ncbi:hypothetical protein CLV24_12912 [Pontibacter ummariensis]|uniref:Uncharacterized protein n=2 Tax=Pontibacter ummariensis TaxID=1610492 RepID=A0A239KJ86_9BACT|nr:hypothetical protein CLV24_12912 [Pontibacter ummariensis]SNT18436.1 hypothetical protein SAMN06296052_12946 [Pontibacter ummariensis]
MFPIVWLLLFMQEETKAFPLPPSEQSKQLTKRQCPSLMPFVQEGNRSGTVPGPECSSIAFYPASPAAYSAMALMLAETVFTPPALRSRNFSCIVPKGP